MKRILTFSWIAVLLLGLVGAAAAQETITPGTPIEGEYAGEPVAYTIEASQGQLIIASMASEDFDTYLALTQADVEIAEDDDSGPDYNALLAYVAQADGTYTLNAGASYFEDAAGPYTLTVDVINPSVITLDEPLTLEVGPSGSNQVYAVFEAASGAVVDIWASTTGEDDVAVSLMGVNGQEIDRDDDDGSDNNALLRRVMLPDTGFYLVRVDQSYSDEPMTSNVTVTVNTSEQLYLTAEPQPLVLGDGEGQAGTEVYTMDVQAGVTYRLIFTIEPNPDEEMGIKVQLLDTDRFFDPELDVQHATRVSWDYLPTSSGTIRVDVHPNLFANDLHSINYTAALEVIEAE